MLSLGCILLSPECLDEARLFLGLSQRVALGSTALLPAGLRRHKDNVGSALLFYDPRRAASCPGSFFGQSLRQRDEKQPLP